MNYIQALRRGRSDDSSAVGVLGSLLAQGPPSSQVEQAQKEAIAQDAAMLTVPRDRINHSQSNLALQFLQQVISPCAFFTTPPATAYDPSFQVISTSTSQIFTKLGLQLLVNEKIPNTSGLIMQYPTFSYDAIFHMGLVPKNTTRAATPEFQSMDQSFVVDFTYNSELAVPYSDANYIFQIKPQVDTKFNLCRMYGSSIEMFISSESANNVALAGNGMTAVVNDTTDVWTTASGQAYTPDGIRVASKNVKEATDRIPLYGPLGGVATIAGDDMQQNFEAPNKFITDRLDGDWAINVLTTPTIKTQVAVGFPAGLQSQYDCIRGIVTPWNISCTRTVANTATCIDFSWNTDPIGEMDSLDIGVAFQVAFPVVYQSTNQRAIVRTTVTHIYGSITDGSTGSMTYRNSASTKDLEILCVTANSKAHVDYIFETNVASGLAGLNGTHSGMSPAGKYLCSLVEVSVFTSNVGGAVQNQNVDFYGIQIRARARRINEPGRLGPVHIMRYDSISQGSDLSVNIHANLQAVAKSELSQYVKSGSLNLTSPANWNVLLLLEALFSASDEPNWKCSWTKADLDAYRKDIEKWTVASFGVETMAHASTAIAARTDAAGLFSALGRTFGGMVGHPNIGNMLGGIADSLTEGGGQFGATQAGGQFGSRASGRVYTGGMRNSSCAAGQFGGY